MVKIFYFISALFLLSFYSCKRSEIDLYRIMENGQFGFVNSTGEVVIRPEYKYVSPFNKYGYATIITEFSKKIVTNRFGISDTCLHIRYGFINKKNELVVDTIHTIDLSQSQFDELPIPDNYEIYADKFSNKNLDFNDYIDGNYIQLCANLFVIQDPKTKLMGYMNTRGDTTITPKYIICNPFYEGVASVSLLSEPSTMEDFFSALNSYILIDSLGKELTQEKYFRINNYDDTCNSWACKLKINASLIPNFEWVLLDNKGNVCSDKIYCTRVYNAKSDFYVYQQTLEGVSFYSFVDKEGKLMTDFNHDGMIALFKETFANVTSFSDSIAGIKIKTDDNYWIFVNKKFDFISQPFDSVRPFKEGLAAVKEYSTDKTLSKWGFVNNNFEEVIPYKYDDVRSFVKELAYFRIGNVEGYINKTGKVIWSHTK